eukprot:313725-Prymnesium_polylepis.2
MLRPRPMSDRSTRMRTSVPCVSPIDRSYEPIPCSAHKMVPVPSARAAASIAKSAAARPESAGRAGREGEARAGCREGEPADTAVTDSASGG